MFFLCIIHAKVLKYRRKVAKHWAAGIKHNKLAVAPLIRL